MKKTAVIILNWNGLKLLQEFLPLAAAYTISDEADLFVADNGSTDGSLEWVREHYPQVRTLDLKENHGFARGYNIAIRETGYPYTVLLNSDVELTEGWLEPMVAFMDRNPGTGASQPKILSYHKREYFEYAGAAGGLLDKHGYPYCRGRLFDRIEKDEGQYDGKVEDVAWASGAALMVRTAVYQQVGGLDERFFAHMEEIDLCLRIRAAGYRVVFIPDSRVYHVGGASLEQGNPFKTYLNFRNNLLLLHKNLPRRQGRRKLFVRRLYDTLAWGMYLVKGDMQSANAILKAHRDFRKMRKDYTEFPDEDYFSTLPGTDRNIITDRYLKGKER